MKRKLLAALLATLALLLTLCSCSCKSSWNCAETKCRNCGADCLECVGCFNDLFNCLPFFLCGEECTDNCGVAPCFTAASRLRTDKNCACSTEGYLDDLEKLDPADYEIYLSLGPGGTISELQYYRKHSYGFSVWAASKDLKDVVVEFSFEDCYGNRIEHALLYLDDHIKATYSSDTKYAVYTISTQNGLSDSFPTVSIDNETSFLLVEDSYSNSYKAVVTIHGVYGTY